MMYENYEINENTLLIIPVSDEISKIYELNETFFISKSVKHIIDHSCKYFGSSYSGRYEGTKHLIGMNYKLPIIIEETKEIIFFPTCSPRQKECCWLSLSNIENYKSNGKKTSVQFKKNITVDIDMSYGSFENQIFRSTMLLMNLKKRKK
ncbi:MAG: competence protein ComK [Candidatus Faecisoma sp.]|nr:competence protein ComK [Acholeplasma sp.]MDY2893108.1 competence protein ComK [Candidatus Faecisoma sp.]CCY27722.1 transcription regulator [Acholeplasma sp. CAG:878]